MLLAKGDDYGTCGESIRCCVRCSPRLRLGPVKLLREDQRHDCDVARFSFDLLVGYQVPCYGLAGLFAIFAGFYALDWIRLSEATVDWHLWLSLIGVAMFGFAFALFARIAATDAGQQAGQGTLFIVAAGLLAGPVVFVVGQFLLVLALIGNALPHR